MEREKVLVYIYDDMADYEITPAVHFLSGDTSKEIVTIAYEQGLIKSRSGVQYTPHSLVKDMVDTDAAALIIPGGWSGEIRPELMELINNLHKKDKLLAAICGGPRFLAKAGILNERKYTTSAAEWYDFLKQRFGEEDPYPRENFVKSRAVVDKNVITANGFAFIDFAIEICQYFNIFEDENERKEFEQSLRGCQV